VAPPEAKSTTKSVAIIMGSQSDWQTMKHAAETLDALDVGYETRIVSAHRTPDRLYAFAKGAKAEGFKVIIAGAGGAAHLPGMTASLTSLPVLGVPVESKALSGQDSLYSIVQMPPGVPVGTLAIGQPGAINAALLAASVLALSDEALSKRLEAWRARQTAAKIEPPMSEGFPALKPEATIGILGGGQLGRMLVLAAARLGFKCHVFSPNPDSPAFDVVRRLTRADYNDTAALDRFAADVDVVTYEFENVPAETATFLAARVPVVPDPNILAITQDRLAEKNFVTALGIGTAPFAGVNSPAELPAAIERVGRPAVLKTRRFGYDGKGQATIKNGSDPQAAWREVGARPCILEAYVPFEREVSVIAARGNDGAVVCFDVTENEHRDHILKFSRVPAALSEDGAKQAQRIAEIIAHKFDYVGVFAVELFVLRDGSLLVNEIAPRVHNSGHWTIDGASVSQFEQHIRAVAGWPLAQPIRHGRVEMTNLIGQEVEDYRRYLTLPGAAVHLYGKAAVRPGRKMGHVTQVFPD
jgi:5-(carboxyamino)imidazole ribonucleotide synthase